MEGASPVVGSKPITRRALCRTAGLGQLYNARTDTFCSTSIFMEQLPPNSPAIRIIDNPEIKVDCNKDHELEVDIQQKLNILAGVASDAESANYRKESKEEESASYEITTVTEELDLERKEIKEMIKTPTMLVSTGATHVVVKIDWGAKCFVSFIEPNSNSKDTKDEERMRESTKLPTEGSRMQLQKYKLVKIYCDSLPDFLPTTVDGAMELLKSLPKRVKEYNGKGKPVIFHMLPLLSLSEPCREVPDREALTVQRLLSHVDELKQAASEFSFNAADEKKARRCKEDLTAQEHNLRCDIKECVEEIRSGKCKTERLTKICDECQRKFDDAYEELEKISIKRSDGCIIQ